MDEGITTQRVEDEDGDGDAAEWRCGAEMSRHVGLFNPEPRAKAVINSVVQPIQQSGRGDFEVMPTPLV